MLTFCRGVLERLTNEEWVGLALQYLEVMINLEPESFPLRYLVLIIDNVDQGGYEVLKQAITTIVNWTDDNSVFWRVFVPVWPTIYERLYRDLNPLPEHHLMTVHMAEPEDLFKKRIDRLMKSAAGMGDDGTNASEWNH